MKALHLMLLETTNAAIRRVAGEAGLPLAAWIDAVLRDACGLPPEKRRARGETPSRPCPACGYATTPRHNWPHVRIGDGKRARVCPACSWPIVKTTGADTPRKVEGT